MRAGGMMPVVMAVSTNSYTVEPVDLATADDDLLREVATLTNAIAYERVPEDPPVPFEAFASRVRNRPAMVAIRDWLVRSAEGELVARGYVVRFEADTNKHFREVGIEVLPAHRRKGIATQLFCEIVAAAGDAGDIVFGFFTNDRVPSAAAFLRRIGAKETLTMHTNQLELSQVDRTMVREWAAIDPKGYRFFCNDTAVTE